MFARNALLIAATAAGLVAAQNGTVVTTTRVVAEYTTYCPEPTTFEFNGEKYVVTEATTLTITDCPCTIVEPCHTCNVVVPPTVTPIPQPKPQPTQETETVPPAKPTEVVAGAARGQTLGYFAAAGVAAAGLLAL